MYSCSPDQIARLLKPCARMVLLLLSLPALPTQALPDDRNQPVHITADKALRDEKEGVTVYSGHVQLVQGSMKLEADKLTIFHTSEDAEEIIAEGNPAKMRQQPELDEGIVNAHAKVIRYFRIEERVLLETDASIDQDGAVVTGDSIEYLIAKQLITAESDQTQEGKKVVVVIPPNVQKKEDSSGATKSE